MLCNVRWQRFAWGVPQDQNQICYVNLKHTLYSSMHLCLGHIPWASFTHYSDVITGAIASQITSLMIVSSFFFRRRSKKTSKLRVTGLCAGTGEFPEQMASNAENVSIWWRHHATKSNKTSMKSRAWNVTTTMWNLRCNFLSKSKS